MNKDESDNNDNHQNQPSGAFCKNSQENTCTRVSFFNKPGGLRAAAILKKRLGTGVFL